MRCRHRYRGRVLPELLCPTLQAACGLGAELLPDTHTVDIVVRHHHSVAVPVYFAKRYLAITTAFVAGSDTPNLNSAACVPDRRIKGAARRDFDCPLQIGD